MRWKTCGRSANWRDARWPPNSERLPRFAADLVGVQHRGHLLCEMACATSSCSVHVSRIHLMAFVGRCLSDNRLVGNLVLAQAHANRAASHAQVAYRGRTVSALQKSHLPRTGSFDRCIGRRPWVVSWAVVRVWPVACPRSAFCGPRRSVTCPNIW